MAQNSRPVSPASQHATFTAASPTSPQVGSPSSTSPVLPTGPASPVNANPQSPTTNVASAQSEPAPPTSTGACRPAAPSHRRASEKTYEVISNTFSPSTHELAEYPGFPAPARPTVRRYDRHVQRWRLWNLVWLEWMITVTLCVALFGLLFGYSRHTIEVHGGLSTVQKRVFNALATGLSIALGLNLAGSLRSYIKILRWRLLATRYRSLTEFELILGAERQSSLLKLIWNARNKRHRFLPSVTQLLCILWIVINFTASVLVAMLGLTYNINQSTAYVSTSNGPVSVVDFNQLIDAGFIDGLGFVQDLGAFGSNFAIINSSLDQADQSLDSYENIADHSRYWFTDYNPNDLSIDDLTTRYVDTFASCNAFPVTAGVFGNLSSISYTKNGHTLEQNIPASGQPGPGGMVFIANTAQTCGTRCTAVNVLQAQADPDQLGFESDVTEAQFFECTVNVSQVYNIPSESSSKYVMQDQIARMFAGAIGWTGEQIPGDSQQYYAYAAIEGIPTGIYETANASRIAQALSSFSIGGVAATDSTSNSAVDRQTIQGDEPGYANYLQVVWWHAGPLLIGLPCLQLASLIAVIALGNRAVIKDDSYLAVAKLYKSTIDKLGNHGDMLRGDEIVNALRDPLTGKEPEVVYGWKELGRDDNGMLGHIDVYDRKTNGPSCKPAFEEGRFDG